MTDKEEKIRLALSILSGRKYQLNDKELELLEYNEWRDEDIK